LYASYAQVLGKTLPYDTHSQLRKRMAEVAPHFALMNHTEQPLWLNGEVMKGLEAIAAEQALRKEEPLRSPVSNFYMTDAVSRSSAIMAKCIIARQEAGI
jgi:NADH dehydrogenase (ubiquinone) Fe-S protein 1